MLLTPDIPPVPTTSPLLTRSDSVFLLALTLALLLAASTFFTPFALAALVAGTLLSVALHRYAGLDPGSPSPDRLVGINIASIRVGGDTGGLIFVLGSIAVVMLGLPSVRWFLLASVAAGVTVAVVRIAWRDRA